MAARSLRLQCRFYRTGHRKATDRSEAVVPDTAACRLGAHFMFAQGSRFGPRPTVLHQGIAQLSPGSLTIAGRAPCVIMTADCTIDRIATHQPRQGVGSRVATVQFRLASAMAN